MAGDKKWTFMVYLAGDNNLESFGTKDLIEMKVAGSSDQVSIVSQFDRMSDEVTRRYYLATEGSLMDNCVAELPEVNTGDPKALADFCSWACSSYPAEHYALVVWNHGTGWKDEDIYRAAEARGLAGLVGRGQVRSLSSGKPGRALFATTMAKLVNESIRRAIAFDDSAADFLDNHELKRVLQQAAPAFGGQLDLLGFDACLMSMLEVDYQLQHLCQVAVSSQENEPGDGWPYGAIIRKLRAEPDMTAETLGRTIVEEYDLSYRLNQPGASVTQSAVVLNRLEPVAGAVGHLGATLLAYTSDRATMGIVFNAVRFAQSFSDRDYIDLGHFCQLLAADDVDGAIGAAAQSVVDLLAAETSPVIAEAHHGPEVTDASGLSIYLPTRVVSPLYRDLDFAQNHGWDEFLSSFVDPNG